MNPTLRTIGITCKDMGATLKFYRLLGFAIAPEADNESNVDFTTNDGLVLGFLAEAVARRTDPTFVTPVGQSLNMQFACASPHDVDAIYQVLMDANYASHTEPWDAFWGQRFARVIDPDGRIVNFYASLPG